FFDDATEKLMDEMPLETSPLFASALIDIPYDAPAGIHRMRVRVVYSTTGYDACSSATWGETHDYDVNVVATSCYRPLEFEVSDVTKNSAVVTVTDNPTNTGTVAYEYEVRESGAPGSGPTGLGVTGTATTNQFTITGLQPLTKYQIYIRTVCSATDNSSWTKPENLTTMCDYPELIAAPDKTVCGPQEVDLTAIFDAGTVKWYDTVTKDSLLYTGANFTTPVLTADTSYWVQAGNISLGEKAVGEGTYTTSGSWEFLYSLYHGYKHQYIFTADELIDAGISAGNITALKFDVVSTGVYNPRLNFSIAMGETTQSVATTTQIANSNLTQVYSNASQPLTTGIMTFTFTTPYVWDGSSNVIVQIASDNGAWSSPYGEIRGHDALATRTSVLYGDNQGIAGILAATAPAGSIFGATSAYRPNTIFVGEFGCASPMVEVKVEVEPKPAFELSTDMVTSCGGGDSEVVTITTNLGGYDTFVWTPSTGVSGDEVNGWTFSSTQEQEYVLSASQSNGICEHLKTVRVFASENPQADATLASTYDLCKNEVAELKAL